MVIKEVNNNYIYVLRYVDNKKKNGFAAIYEKDSKIKRFFGQLTNGKVTGQGKLYSSSGNLIYRGHFINNKKCGDGISYHQNGTISYKGLWENDLQAGQGTYYDSEGSIVYDGLVIGGLFEVDVSLFEIPLTINDSISYIGQRVRGERNGFGKMYINSKNELDFIDQNSQSVDRIYIGQWKNNLPHGTGNLYINGVLRYEGEFWDGDFKGTGNLYDENGNLRFSGEIRGSSTGPSHDIEYHQEELYILENDFFMSDKIPVWIWGNWKGRLNLGSGKFFTKTGKEWFEGNIEQ